MESENSSAALPTTGIAMTVARARERIGASVQEILEELATSVGDTASAHARTEGERAAAFARAGGRREVTESLNAVVRRFKQADSRQAWARTLLDATEGFCRSAALFEVRGEVLRYEVAGGDQAEVVLTEAPAFAGAVESRDTVVAAATPRELSPAIANIVAPEPSARAYLFPILGEAGVSAVLCASPGDDGSIDVSGLELLTALAACWTVHEAVEEPAGSGTAPELVTIAAAPVEERAPKPPWSELSTSDRELHLKAQRFARTRVAEVLLRAGDRVQKGRDARSLYRTLKEEIDSIRGAFRKQFVEPCTSMVDYLHLEFVGTLAKGDAALLGADYPGPLP